MPSSFVDLQNRTWTIDLTIADARRVKAECGVELTKIMAAGLKELLDDIHKTIEVVTSILKPDLEKAGLSVEQFEQALGGEQVESMQECLLIGLSEFLPSRDARRAIVDVIKRSGEAKKLIADKVVKQLDALTAEAIADKAMAIGNTPQEPTP